MDITNNSVKRDRAQAECWSRTVKELVKQFKKSEIWVADYLLALSDERFNDTLILYGREWGVILKDLGGAR